MTVGWAVRRSRYTGETLDRRTALKGDGPTLYLTAIRDPRRWWVLEIHLGSRMKAPEHRIRFQSFGQIRDLVDAADATEDPYTHLIGDLP